MNQMLELAKKGISEMGQRQQTALTD